MNEILIFLIGGLILFIYSIGELSRVMEDLFSKQAVNIIERFTKRLFSAILIGTITTILLGSSSAVIILAIVFINAKSLTFRQAMGIIMGANIGTTFSSQIIALDVAKYSIIPLAAGLILQFITGHKKYNHYGQVLFYFGLLFFGLHMMESSVLPLQDSKVFKQWITSAEQNIIKGTLIGGFITLIIQSSSATVGIAIVLGKQNLLSIAGGIAIMLGAELGTCSDTLIATIRGSRQALKAGLFHLLFNMTTISVGLVLFNPFLDLIKNISAGQGIDNHIANAHMFFNILGVVFFIPFVGITERFLNRVLPDNRAF
jgi:phosphate:Na+ symporter